MFWIVLLFVTAAGATSSSVLFTNTSGVFIFNASSAMVEPLLRVVEAPEAVDYRFSDGDVYALVPGRRIVRIGLPTNSHNQSGGKKEHWCARDKICTTFFKTSSNIHEFLALNVSCKEADNLLVDWHHDKIYWTCGATSKNNYMATINWVASDNSARNKIELGNCTIRSLAVDPCEKKLFWLISDSKGYIAKKSELSGESPQVIYQFDKNIKHLSEIVVDPTTKTIYVSGNLQDSNDTFLGRMGYDGSDYKELYSCKGDGWPLGPSVVNGTLYWLSDSPKSKCVSLQKDKERFNMEAISVPQMKYQAVRDWKVFDTTAQSSETDCPASNPPPAGSSTPSAVPSASDGTETTSTGSNAPAVVSASSEEMTAFYMVVIVILVALFMVVVLVKRRSRTGNYRPATPEDHPENTF